MGCGSLLRLFVDALQTVERGRRGGLGLFHTKDTRRDHTVSDWDDEYIYYSRRWTLAPSRLELSFAYLF